MTDSQSPHIVTAFDRDLEEIQAHVMRMGGLVEEAIRNAVLALRTSDEDLAEKVRRGDRAVDELEHLINQECARLIAMRQPAASDMRLVLAVMKIAHNLERIGDYAKNIAKRTAVLVQMPQIEGVPGAIRRMANEVLGMLSDVLDAFVRRDAALADEVRHRDLDVDQMYNALFRELITFMIEDPRNITPCMHYHFIAKNIERMGDHVTSIGDQVIYTVTGEMPEEPRPKGTDAVYRPTAGGAGEPGQ